MAGYSAAGRNAALAGVIAQGGYLSLHTADPGTTGASEDTGVTRKASGWGSPASGSVSSAQVPFAVNSGGGTRNYTHFGVWTALTGGTFICGGALDAAEQFSNNGGTYNFTATLTAA